MENNKTPKTGFAGTGMVFTEGAYKTKGNGYNMTYAAPMSSSVMFAMSHSEGNELLDFENPEYKKLASTKEDLWNVDLQKVTVKDYTDIHEMIADYKKLPFYPT